LSPEAHEILLGVLKKVEAKSAVLLTVVIFLLAGLLPEGSEFSEKGVLTFFIYWASIGFLVGPLWSAIHGAGHLGQPHYAKMSKKVARIIRPKEMQRCLILDLVSKEYSFRASVWLIGVSIACAVLQFALISAPGSFDTERKRPVAPSIATSPGR
jgi:hypothetical protein